MAVGRLLLTVGSALKNAYDKATSNKNTSSSSGSSSKKTGGSSNGTSNVQSAYQATGTYNDSGISASDKQKIDAYKQAYADAQAKGDTAGMEKAHAGAEAIRSAYNYSGGTDGSEYRQLYGGNIDTPYSNDIYNSNVGNKYKAMNEQISNMNASAVKQGIDNIEAQRDNIVKGYEDQARQNYIAYKQSEKALPQQMASQGLTGGMTETSNLQLATNYQTNNNNINVAKQNAMQELDNAITDLKNTGNLQTAQQILENEQSALNAYLNFYNNGVAYNQWQTEFNANQQQQEYENQQNEAQIRYNQALNALQMGNVTEETAKILGLDYENAKILASYYQAGMKSSGSGSSSGGSGQKESTPTSLTYSNINKTIASWLDKVNNAPANMEDKDIDDIRFSASKYLVENVDDINDVIAISKQNKLTPEQIARAMKAKGSTREEIIAMIYNFEGGVADDEYIDRVLDLIGMANE